VWDPVRGAADPRPGATVPRGEGGSGGRNAPGDEGGAGSWEQRCCPCYTRPGTAPTRPPTHVCCQVEHVLASRHDLLAVVDQTQIHQVELIAEGVLLRGMGGCRGGRSGGAPQILWVLGVRGPKCAARGRRRPRRRQGPAGMRGSKRVACGSRPGASGRRGQRAGEAGGADGAAVSACIAWGVMWALPGPGGLRRPRGWAGCCPWVVAHCCRGGGLGLGGRRAQCRACSRAAGRAGGLHGCRREGGLAAASRPIAPANDLTSASNMVFARFWHRCGRVTTRFVVCRLPPHLEVLIALPVAGDDVVALALQTLSQMAGDEASRAGHAHFELLLRPVALKGELGQVTDLQVIVMDAVCGHGDGPRGQGQARGRALCGGRQTTCALARQWGGGRGRGG